MSHAPGLNRIEARVLVVGLVRDAAAGIEAEVQRLGQALACFAQVRWLLVESDSRDDTVRALQRLAVRVPGFAYLSLGALQPRLPLRTQRIAHCRNAYMQALDEAPEYAEVDLVLMADLDGINTLVDEAAILSCFARDDWGVCTANPAGPYYDVWALRHPLWSPNDCKAAYRFLVEHGTEPERALQSTVLSRMISLPTQGPWLEVDSAFGGLALYRRELLRGLRYEGVAPDGQESCEHVALHAAIRARGGRVYINPALVCAGVTEHVHSLRLSKRVHRWLRDNGKRVLVALWPERFGKPGNRAVSHDAG